MLSALLDLILPPKCAACRTILKHDQSICSSCRGKITLNTTLFCGQCRLPLSSPTKTCHKSFPYILGAATEYLGPIKKLIHALKFNLITGAAEELGVLLLDYAQKVNLNLNGKLIVPIPLSKQRERERGFNQSERIAEVFAARLDLSIAPAALRRIRNTPAQSKTTSLYERSINVANCFNAQADLVANRSIILVDDVVTSGATLREAALTLKSAGARDIIALACSKA